MLYHLIVDSSQVNDTHVFIPSATSVFGTFVRSTHVSGSYEYGTVEQRWGENPGSVFPDVVSGVAERHRTLYHDGPWPTDSLEAAMDVQNNRWWTTKALAESSNTIRIKKQFMYIGQAKAGTQMRNAAIDPNHTAKLQDFASSDGGRPSDHLRFREYLLSLNITNHASLATAGALPSSTASNCYHFQNHTGIQITSTGSYYPLDTKLVSFKGSMVYSPQQHVDFTSGISMFSYNNVTGILSVYLAGSSFLEIIEPVESTRPAHGAAFYISPVDGETMESVGEDARVQPIGPSTVIRGLYNVATALPIDYEYLYQDEAELCPEEKFTRLAQEAEDMDIMDLKESFSMSLINHLVETLDCGTTFLRSAHLHGNGVGFLEIITWAHFLMEAPQGKRLQNVFNWMSDDLTT
jgi:hypothetical protein